MIIGKPFEQSCEIIGSFLIIRRICMENYLMKEMVVGIRSRGRQKTRMTNAIKEKLGLTITEAIKTVQDRKK